MVLLLSFITEVLRLVLPTCFAYWASSATGTLKAFIYKSSIKLKNASKWCKTRKFFGDHRRYNCTKIEDNGKKKHQGVPINW